MKTKIRVSRLPHFAFVHPISLSQHFLSLKLAAVDAAQIQGLNQPSAYRVCRGHVAAMFDL